MRSILFRNDPDQEDSLMADLWEIGAAGIAEESGGWRVFFDGSVDINPLLRRYQSLAVETREEQSRDWQLVSREGWDRFLLENASSSFRRGLATRRHPDARASSSTPEWRSGPAVTSQRSS
jgi:hypothetical protein